MSRVLGWVRRNSLLLFGWGVVCLVYGAFALQGALPLLSPDETAVFTLARTMGDESRVGLFDARAQTHLWLHPRSFLVRDGWLLPVGFPLWPVVLSAVGWMGSGSAILWLQVLVCASAVIPLTLLAERVFAWRRWTALAWAFVPLTSPLAVLYGARGGFTLMPQVALLAWTGWGLVRGTRARGLAFGVGVLGAVTIGLRPTEIVWIAPVILALAYQSRAVWEGCYRWLALGTVVGAATVLGVHWWVYGAPWRIGYLLPSSSSLVAATPAAVEVAISSWRRWLPYGVSLSQLRANVDAAFWLGWWPWAIGIVAVLAAWVAERRARLSRGEGASVILLTWMTLWLLFYYGQGRYADHIGGQQMHLGSSFLRYMAPAVFGWLAFAAWAAMEWARRARWRAAVVVILLCSSIGGGITWAYTDAEDGLLRGRREREMYGDVRQTVQSIAPADSIWVSDRSDKMLFPSRMSVSPVPAREELFAFLQGQQGQVFLFARPPRQAERDAWMRAGLELIERQSFARETVYEVRLRPGFAEVGTNRAH